MELPDGLPPVSLLYSQQPQAAPMAITPMLAAIFAVVIAAVLATVPAVLVWVVFSWDMISFFLLYRAFV